jgi:hypothetical protein
MSSFSKSFLFNLLQVSFSFDTHKESFTHAFRIITDIASLALILINFIFQIQSYFTHYNISSSILNFAVICTQAGIFTLYKKIVKSAPNHHFSITGHLANCHSLEFHVPIRRCTRYTANHKVYSLDLCDFDDR